MKVILLERVRNLGALGDNVNVKSGFARNFLIPKGIAVHANAINIAKFEERRVELEKVAAEKHQQALARQQKLNNISVTIRAKAGDEGKLFGSIGTRDIVEALNKAGCEIEKREISLSTGTLRMVGEYEVSIELESDVTAIVKVNVVPEA